MLPCSRSCLRGRSRRIPSTLDHGPVGFEESLLFLYPRWFTTTAQLRQAPATFNAVAPVRNERHHGRASVPRCRNTEFRLYNGPESRFMSTCSSETLQANTVSTDVLGESTTNLDAQIPPAGDKAYVTVQENTGNKIPPSPGKKSTRHDSSASAAPKDRSEQTDEQPGSSFSQNASSTETPSARTRLRYIAPRQDRSSPKFINFTALSKLMPRDRAKVKYRLFRRELNPERREPHWRALFEMLESMQKETKKWRKVGMQVKEIYLPEETVALLTGDVSVRENVFFVLVRNGCRVNVRPVEEGDGPNRKLVLTGSERAVELVSSRLRRLQRSQADGDPLIDLQKPPFPMIMDIETMRNPPLVRGVWMDDPSSKTTITLEKYDVPSLTVASIKELVERLEDITTAPLKRGNVARERIARMIRALFQHEPNQQVMSTAALYVALEWLCRHNFLSTARDIFTKVERVATADSFNLLLRLCAKRQDFRMFQQLLAAMSRLEIRPNGSTWVAFLELLAAPTVKTFVAQKIHANGYLSDISSYRSALQSTVFYDLKTHLQSGRTVDSFIDEMSKSEKSNWFTEPLMSQMFEAIAALKDFKSMERLMTICHELALPIGGQLLNHIIPMYNKDMWKALERLFWFPNSSKLRFTPVTYEMLFFIAYKGKHFNVCRVLWRYACMARCVTYRMEDAVLGSMTRKFRQVLKRRQPRDWHWLRNAGKVIMGIDLRTPDFKLPPHLASQIPAKYREDPVSFFFAKASTREERLFQLRIYAWLVQRDQREGPTYRPEVPLSLMLDAAACIDYEWREERPPAESIADEAIQVNVRRGQGIIATELMADLFS